MTSRSACHARSPLQGCSLAGPAPPAEPSSCPGRSRFAATRMPYWSACIRGEVGQALALLARSPLALV